MTQRLGLLVLLVALGAVACRAPAEEPTTGTARLDALLADYEGPDRPGACLLVRQGGQDRYRRCVGLGDVASGTPATPQTNFRLASVTKQMTAVAVLHLVDTGRLTLDASLPDVLPGFPAYGAAITVRHLLTHTSGLLAYETLLPSGQTTQVRDADVLAMMMAQDSTYFAPGTAWRYSNSGYALLAMIVEQQSGQSFPAYLNAHLFEPLGMRHTVAHVEGQDIVTYRAYGHEPSGETWVRADQSLTSAVLGDGGVYSSLDDFSRWLALVDGQEALVDAALMEAAFTPVQLADGRTHPYGFGWNLGPDPGQGSARYSHTGSTQGFRTYMMYEPDSDLSLVFLSNRNAVAEGLYGALAAAAAAVIASEDAPSSR